MRFRLCPNKAIGIWHLNPTIMWQIYVLQFCPKGSPYRSSAAYIVNIGSKPMRYPLRVAESSFPTPFERKAKCADSWYVLTMIFQSIMT